MVAAAEISRLKRRLLMNNVSVSDDMRRRRDTINQGANVEAPPTDLSFLSFLIRWLKSPRQSACVFQTISKMQAIYFCVVFANKNRPRS